MFTTVILPSKRAPPQYVARTLQHIGRKKGVVYRKLLESIDK